MKPKPAAPLRIMTVEMIGHGSKQRFRYVVTEWTIKGGNGGMVARGEVKSQAWLLRKAKALNADTIKGVEP